VLVDAKRKHQAIVRADGTLARAVRQVRSTRSAHWCRASTPATAGPSGMSKRPNGLKLIDDFRTAIRQEMARAG
jgi:modification methylase